MRRMLRRFGWILLLVALALPQPAHAQATRTVTGVVTDAASGAPVADVLVTVDQTGLRAVTDAEGRFRIAGAPAGRAQMLLRHVAYGEHTVVAAAGASDFRIRISSQAVELLPVVVRVGSDELQARRASGNSINVIDRPRIEALAQQGETFGKVLLDVPNIHYNETCIEYRLRANTLGIEGDLPANAPSTSQACRNMAVYVDGIWMPDARYFIDRLSLYDVERIQVLSPSEASVRYQDAARGVLLIETRRPSAPESPDEHVTVTGFAWDEPRPYPWLRVLGLSAAGNAGAMALAYAALDCHTIEGWELARSSCTPLAGTGAAIFTATVSGLVTRWAGATPRTRGRTVPVVALGTVTASVGYVLRVRGEQTDSPALRTAGDVILAVAVPVTLTLADRVFRVVR